jgi:hypothetical protein
MADYPDLSTLRILADCLEDQFVRLLLKDLEYFGGSFWPEGTYDLVDEWRERAAIFEFDAGMPRDKAEEKAYKLIFKTKGKP